MLTFAVMEEQVFRIERLVPDQGDRFVVAAPPSFVLTRPGLVGSVVLHALVALLVLSRVGAFEAEPRDSVHVIPAELVELAEATTSPPAARKAAVPQQQASLAPRQAPLPSRRTPRTRPPDEPSIAKTRPLPDETAPPRDPLQEKLERLAKLKQTDASPSVLPNSGISNATAAGRRGRSGERAAYSLKDYVEAQVERRWSIDLAGLKDVDVDILIHVVMARDGTIEEAEIVNETRAKTDAAYRDIAISARNAVLLSSPIALPAGRYAPMMNLTLTLNPRAVKR